MTSELTPAEVAAALKLCEAAMNATEFGWQASKYLPRALATIVALRESNARLMSAKSIPCGGCGLKLGLTADVRCEECIMSLRAENEKLKSTVAFYRDALENR